ncbi:glycosyltransferase family 2 protein [Pedobacter frigiditerrae]|uniref:Glycosyltransferase family 2 protein n=1 Tax=Pedobacter frigiditerrae TaxID=2530452 RepID=A0A4R0N5J7_9SPHI|nr:glycosyltransferase family 2 protein [Pedobacter frigiditerrae]TCC93534.1 glycosyltransferase family 2 protein [Pedobacter frigiditerrae]
MSQHTSLVSIALCTYNGEKYLKAQLDSLVIQDYQNLEIIIVDDCSTDNTVSIIKEYQKLRSNITLYINEKNLGFNKNFKKALENCKGDYIAFADQDDMWELNKISKMVENIGDNLLIYHNSAYIDENGIPNGLSKKSHHKFVSGDCAINFLYYNCVSGHACMINKDLLETTPPFPKDFYYDWWFAYTAANTGRINFLNESLVKHRKHSNSSTSADHTDPRSLRLYQFKLFLAHPMTIGSVKEMLLKLIHNYEELRFKKFSLKLFSILIRNAHQLFYIRKKSVYSRLKFLITESTQHQ